MQQHGIPIASFRHRARSVAALLLAYMCCAASLFCASAGAQQSLSLHDAIQLGLAHAPEVRTSADQVQLQRAQIAQARLRPNPRLYIQSEDLRPWDSNFSFPSDTEDYAYLSATLELDGKRHKRVAYAESGLRRAEAEHTLQLRQIASGIATSYWNALAARASVTEWQHQLADFNRIVTYQSERVKSGATAGVDLLRTQMERDRVALSYAQAQRDAEAAALDLARRTASLSAATATLTEPLEQPRLVPAMPINDAVEQRPDVLAAREAVTETHADLRLQHADAVPNLDLLGGYKRDVGANTAYGGLQMDLPFFNRNQGGIASAAAGSQLADDQLAYTRLKARSEITLAVSNYTRESGLVTTTLPGMQDRAMQNAGIISDAYRSGGTDLLRYLDAQRMLIETRLLAIQTWAEYQRAAVLLQLAYGEQP